MFRTMASMTIDEGGSPHGPLPLQGERRLARGGWPRDVPQKLLNRVERCPGLHLAERPAVPSQDVSWASDLSGCVECRFSGSIRSLSNAALTVASTQRRTTSAAVPFVSMSWRASGWYTGTPATSTSVPGGGAADGDRGRRSAPRQRSGCRVRPLDAPPAPSTPAHRPWRGESP